MTCSVRSRRQISYPSLSVTDIPVRSFSSPPETCNCAQRMTFSVRLDTPSGVFATRRYLAYRQFPLDVG
uniref:Uncharacterized protein n=1 Tax=Anopheles atroparvus TaxID=41427 RepID=A0AAG5DU77_ANOAO